MRLYLAEGEGDGAGGGEGRLHGLVSSLVGAGGAQPLWGHSPVCVKTPKISVGAGLAHL